MELESDEICNELAITANNLWVILYRARMALRDASKRTGSKAKVAAREPLQRLRHEARHDPPRLGHLLRARTSRDSCRKARIGRSPVGEVAVADAPHGLRRVHAVRRASAVPEKGNAQMR